MSDDRLELRVEVSEPGLALSLVYAGPVDLALLNLATGLMLKAGALAPAPAASGIPDTPGHVQPLPETASNGQAPPPAVPDLERVADELDRQAEPIPPPSTTTRAGRRARKAREVLTPAERKAIATAGARARARAADVEPELGAPPPAPGPLTELRAQVVAELRAGEPAYCAHCETILEGADLRIERHPVTGQALTVHETCWHEWLEDNRA